MMVTCMRSRASRRAALRPPNPAPTTTTREMLALLPIAPPYKIEQMAVGSKTFPEELPGDPIPSLWPLAVSSKWRPWLETLWVFGLLEAVLWTPHSFVHSILIAL